MLRKENIKNVYMQSPMQEGMFYHFLLDETSHAYFEQISYRLHGSLSISLVRKSLNELLKRYDILRTVFIEKNGKLLQVVLKEVGIGFYYEDISLRENKQEYILRYKETDKNRSFDIRRDVLMRVAVLQVEKDEYEIIWSHHHIIMDGWCIGILISEFFEIYSCYLEGKTYHLPEVKQYRTFIKWLQGQDNELSRKYWRQYLENYDEHIGLPGMDSSRPVNAGYRHEQFIFNLDKESTGRLIKVTDNNQITLNTVIRSIWGILLSKYNNRQDVVFGAVVSGRPAAIRGVERMVGLFINTIPVRIRYDGNMKFIDLLNSVQEQAIESQSYHYLSLAEIQSQTTLKQNLIDHILVFENYPIAERIDGLADRKNDSLLFGLSNVENFEQTNYDFNLLVSSGVQVTFKIIYNAHVFSKEIIEKIINTINNIIIQVSDNRELLIEDIMLLSAAEKERIIYEFNDTRSHYPRDKTIHQLFEEQVGRTPDNTAAAGPILEPGRLSKEKEKQGSKIGGGYHVLTYRELNEQAVRLAGILRVKGVRPDTVVSVMLERSIEMIIGLFGILKAGGAYMPIDPRYPKERKKYMIEESCAGLLLTCGDDDEDVEDLRNCGVEAFFLEKIEMLRMLEIEKDSHMRLSSFSHPQRPLNLAYMIYTSGSTGKPKGVMIDHYSLVNRLHWMQQSYQLNERDTILQKTTYTFDVSVWELFWWSIVGAKCCLLLPGGEKSPEMIVEAIERNNVTTMHFVPSMLNVFLLYVNDSIDIKRLSSLRQVFSSGEALTPAMVQLFAELLSHRSRTRLLNLYGPTEATVDVSYFECLHGEELERVPIGRPIDNIRIYIVDKSLHMQPINIPGELCISGDGLARGYLNKPALTAEKFVSAERIAQGVDQKVIGAEPAAPVGANLVFARDPHHSSFITHHSALLYKTGDLARWLSDGNIEFLGRIDQQVKVRGFRIELGEIESQLLKHDKIRDAVVIAKKDRENNNFLCAYIEAYREIPVSQLREYLLQQLPEYMVPSYFVHVEKIPLTYNGKVDKNKLPEIDVRSEEAYAAPTDEVEEELSKTWREILDLEKVGVNDNFFLTGGDSIKAIRLISLANNRFNTKLKVADLFSNETIRKLANFIKHETIIPADEELLAAQKEIEELRNRIISSNMLPGDTEDVFLMSDIEKGMIFYAYHNPDEAVYHDQFVYSRRYTGFKPGIFKRALTLMMEKHPILRTSYNVENFDEFVHIIHKSAVAAYKHFDISKYNQAPQEHYIQNYMVEDRRKRWDISSPPLWRMATFDLGDNHICAVWTFHHAILDGWSNASFITELNNTYLKLNTDKDFIPERLKVNFKDFILREIAEKKKERNINFWLKELQDYKRISFPESGDSKTGNGIGEVHDLEKNYDPPFLEKLVNISKKYDVSLKNICFAAYAYMMNMLSYENDVVVGLITDNRPEIEDGDKILGCFLNTVPFRLKIPGCITWREYINLVNNKLIELKKYEKMTFFEIIKVIGERNRAENPIFDTIFYYVDFHIYRQVIDENSQVENGKRVLVQGYERTNTLFDFRVSPYSWGISVGLRYSTSIVTDQTVKRLFSYFENILNLIINKPGNMIRKCEIISLEERNYILYKLNNTKAAYPGDRTIHGLIEEQAAKKPDNIASLMNSDRLSYKKLSAQADQLAHLLRDKGIRANTIVGIMVERSLEMLIGIFGILKAGGAYMPLDPWYPKERIRYMMEESCTGLLLTSRDFYEKVKGLRSCAVATIYIEEKTGIRDEQDNGESMYLPATAQSAKSKAQSESYQEIRSAVSPDSLAYVIYTSGSTGWPKGVLVEHGSLVNRLNWMDKRYKIYEHDTILQKTPFTFDVSVWEIFWWALAGAKVCMLAPGSEKDPARIAATIERNRVSIIHFVPSMLNAFLEYLQGVKKFKNISSLRQVFSSGEALSLTQVKFFNKYIYSPFSTKLTNLYGPTEATVDVSFFDCPADNNFDRVPIGKPIDNIRLYVVDRYLQLQPPGISGELCISGKGLARGYLNQPELTAEKFKRDVNSHSSLVISSSKKLSPNDRLYKTGDFARWLPNGDLEFLGRIDHQVKVRGFRIEPGEIEAQLLNLKEIKDAVVLTKQGKDRSHFLCAYIVSDAEFSSSRIRQFLLRQLPDYMCPSEFIRVEKIPLTPNGKVDRRALALSGIKLGTGIEYVPPGNEIEKILVEIWRGTLHVDKIGIHDNFFDLGGDSMVIMKVVGKIRTILGKELAVVKMYQYSTIHSLSDYLGRENEADVNVDRFGEQQKLNRMEDIMEETVLFFEET